MKNTLSYILVFLTAFVGTSAVIYVLNQEFNNVFQFDFSPKQPIIIQMPSDSTTVSDSLSMMSDSLSTRMVADTTDYAKEIAAANDLANDFKTKFDRSTQQLEAKDQEIERLKNTMISKSDSAYTAWVKKTVKVYEAMDPKQAAKLLASITIQEARDIIYKMKQKKAAAILSELSVDKGISLTRSDI